MIAWLARAHSVSVGLNDFYTAVSQLWSLLMLGVVYKGRWHGPVAIKRLLARDPDQAELEGFRNEVQMLQKTRHDNVLLFLGACTGIIFSYCAECCVV
jgi:hypothetical protein